MGKRYYCEYCNRHFADSPGNRRNHINGVQHKRNRKMHYDSYKDPLELLSEEAQKLPCRRFFQTGTCDFGENCRYSHTNPQMLLEKRARVMSSRLKEREPILHEWLAKWERKRPTLCSPSVVFLCLLSQLITIKLSIDEFEMADEEESIYPLQIIYCGVCSLPNEYCEYNPSYDQCIEWWKGNYPDEYEEMIAQGLEALDVGGTKKRQTRGGKGVVKTKKKANAGPKKVKVSLSQRNKKKFVTVVSGLKTFDIDVKKAAKSFGQKFACGTSITGGDEIIIQGDVKDDIIDFIQEKWPEVDDDSIQDLGTKK
ncbi:density-regulated protein homolog [Xenia sp. Carnegie-2017]|uniref:density-regulated protein homolog n=1 Tax=Xenia sp. Carnegie-2017 TaxID=2897299 RepID=UPI001F040C28|nr:density-regulated protein homolog [Xenia sp. Carnegie-2017]